MGTPARNAWASIPCGKSPARFMNDYRFSTPSMYSSDDSVIQRGEYLLATQKKGREPSGVAAVDRALAIVQAIASQPEPCSLAKLSASTDLYKSTILRLLGSLENARYITRLSDGNYTLGPAIFRLGLAYEHANPLGEIVLPVLELLVKNGTESASLHIRHNATSRVCLVRVNSNHSTLDRIQAGDILPIDRGAAGRLLAAFDGEAGATAEHLRESCFALSVGERDPACAGVACPVFGSEGTVKGVLSLSGPRERFTPAAITRMRELLLAAAKTVTQELGGKFPEIPKDYDAPKKLLDAPSPKKSRRSSLG